MLARGRWRGGDVRVVRRALAEAPAHLVQRALCHRVLDQSLVDACAQRGQTPRPLSLHEMRTCTGEAAEPSHGLERERVPFRHARMASREEDRTARSQPRRAVRRPSPFARLFASSREPRDALHRLSSRAHECDRRPTTYFREGGSQRRLRSRWYTLFAYARILGTECERTHQRQLSRIGNDARGVLGIGRQQERARR